MYSDQHKTDMMTIIADMKNRSDRARERVTVPEPEPGAEVDAAPEGALSAADALPINSVTRSPVAAEDAAELAAELSRLDVVPDELLSPPLDVVALGPY